MSQHSPWVVNLQLGFDSPNQRQAAASESPRRTPGESKAAVGSVIKLDLTYRF